MIMKLTSSKFLQIWMWVLLVISGCCVFWIDKKVEDIEQIDATITENTKYGYPCKTVSICQRKGYALGYSDKHKQPLWVSYELTRSQVVTRVCTRSDKFRPDPYFTNSPSLLDYKNSGYDRGHLAPAADMHWDPEAMHDSFYLSNMSPQVPGFNRGIWKQLEEWVRRTASNEVSVFVITGPIFYTNRIHKAIGKINKITVPDAYYKIIYDETPPVKMIGFILNNQPSTNSLDTFTCTVDDIEKVTGLDFFSLLNEDKEQKLESTVNTNDWSW